MYLNDDPIQLDSCYKYYSWDRTKSLLSNLAPLISKTIRYNSIFDFNDQFDSRIIIKQNGKIEEDLTNSLLRWIDSSKRVACFTINSVSPYMWGQYASKNTGYMIEYSGIKMQKITYSTNPIVYRGPRKTHVFEHVFPETLRY
jgi:hypothetical protein